METCYGMPRGCTWRGRGLSGCPLCLEMPAVKKHTPGSVLEAPPVNLNTGAIPAKAKSCVSDMGGHRSGRAASFTGNGAGKVFTGEPKLWVDQSNLTPSLPELINSDVGRSFPNNVDGFGRQDTVIEKGQEGSSWCGAVVIESD